ncbi:hypothetical protein QQP08_013721 [Theobroma cacao]|nr:hypothetical protein QQP08_013721 [Theobroma cacao]
MKSWGVKKVIQRARLYDIVSWRIDVLFMESFVFTSEVELLMLMAWIGNIGRVWSLFGLALVIRLRSSLWLQFKPHHIAAGAAYLAAKFLNFDLASSNNIWQEFQTTPAILQDVSQQLMELF